MMFDYLKIINRVVITSCYLFLFSFTLPPEIVELFKAVASKDTFYFIIIHGAILFKSLGITFVMCFLMIISFYLLKRMVRLFLKFRDLATRNPMIFQIKTKLYEISYPLNLKHALVHFLIIIIYIISIRNGIANCMITEEDISKVSDTLTQVEKALDISMKKLTERLNKDMGPQTDTSKKSFNRLIENLFDVIRNNYSSIRDSILMENGTIGKGIINTGEHKGKFFMDVIAEKNVNWLYAKKHIYYPPLCTFYAQEIAEKMHMQESLATLKQKLIAENIAALKQDLIDKNMKSEIEFLKMQLEKLKKVHEEQALQIVNLEKLEKGQVSESLNTTLIGHQREIIDEKTNEIKSLNNQLEQQNSEMKKTKNQLAQKNLEIKSLRAQVEKNNLNNLRRDIHYQYAGMAAMGVGIAVTGGYLLSKCI